MRFGVCIPYREVVTLQDIPFDYLEENVQRFLVPEQSEEVFAAHLRETQHLPVPVEAANSLLPASLPIIATPQRPVDNVRLEHYIKTALRRAEQAGIHILVFGSGAARRCPEDYDINDAIEQVGERLAQWSIWGKAYSIEFALEPLRFEETNVLNTMLESGTLIATLHDSGATLLADTYHMACNNESPDVLLHWSSLLSHVHVAEKQERAAPGRYGENLRPYLSALHRADYNRRISIECNWRDFATEVAPAIATLKEQWRSSATVFDTTGESQ